MLALQFIVILLLNLSSTSDYRNGYFLLLNKYYLNIGFILFPFWKFFFRSNYESYACLYIITLLAPMSRISESWLPLSCLSSGHREKSCGHKLFYYLLTRLLCSLVSDFCTRFFSLEKEEMSPSYGEQMQVKGSFYGALMWHCHVWSEKKWNSFLPAPTLFTSLLFLFNSLSF